MMALAVGALVLGACTRTGETAPSEVPEETSVVVQETPATTAASTTTLPPIEVDIGVDLESSTLRVGVAGAVSDEARAGHDAYWASVGSDLGGIGGRFTVETISFDSVEAAASGDVVAVSLDGGTVQPISDLLAAAPEQTVEAVAAGRLRDHTRPTFGAILGAASELAASEDFVTAGALGVVAGETCVFDPMVYQLTEGSDADFVLICGTPDDVAAALPELGADTAAVFVADEAWDPSLIESLPESTYVLGFIPPPGDDAPASDVLAAVVPETPWPPDFVRGYTAALTMHLVLEDSLAAGDLTRAGVTAMAGAGESADLGFGTQGVVTVAAPDAESATGLVVVDRVPVQG
jgi:hypothetical protein